jgi:hypothetical protein
MAGIATGEHYPVGANTSGGSAWMVRPTTELALLGGFTYGSSKLCAGPSLTADLFWLHADSEGRIEQKTALAVAMGVKTSYQYDWTSDIFVRGDVSANLELRGVDLVYEVETDNQLPYPSTRIWFTLSLGLGMRF